MVNLANEFSSKYPNMCCVIGVTSVKPLDQQVLSGIDNGVVVTLEENVLLGGFGQTITAWFADNNKNVKVVKLGVADNFVKHGTVVAQMQASNLTIDGIVEKLIETGKFTKGDFEL